MKHSRFLLFTLALSLNLLLHAQSTRTYYNDPLLAPREHNVDFQHLRLDIAFEPVRGIVKGKVTHYFTPLRPKVDSILLDGIDMEIKNVTVNGKPAKFINDSSTIIVYTPSLSWEQKDSMSITYECAPRQGLYFIGWNDKSGLCRKQIWSQGQGIDNRNWIPMYDEMNDKVTTEMNVQFDTAYRVLSNGKFIGKKIKGGTATWSYRLNKPTAPYLIMLGIGKYAVKESKSASGVPLYFWYYPEWKDRVETTYQHSEKIFDFFEKEIGVPFPWESYSQIPVQDFMYGAMENTTATVFGDFFFNDERGALDRGYVSVNAHELAHQWFGDFVTARSDAHHWLQESFATHYNWMAEKEVFGQDHFDWGRRQAQINALDESKRNQLPVAHSEAGSVRHYPKGAFVLYMLKNVLGGREVYNKVIKYYLEKHPYGNVDTEDLLVACHEVTGLQLDWFFEEWLYKGGEPSYFITFENVLENPNDKNAAHFGEFCIRQIQEISELTGLPSSNQTMTNSVNQDEFVQASRSRYSQAGLFKMPVVLEVYFTDGTSESRKVVVHETNEKFRFRIPEGKKVDYVLFDPNNEVMKAVNFQKSFEMLKAQAVKAKYMLDRYDAVTAMASIDIERKRDFLVELYSHPTAAGFYAIRMEIIKQLSQDNNRKSIEVLRKGLADKDLNVRRTVMENFKLLPEELLADVEKLLKDPSYDIITKALDYLTFSNPEKIGFYLEQTKDVEGMPGRNVKIKWLELSSLMNPKYVDQLVSFCSNAFEFRTRVNAMISLKKLNYLDDTAIEYLLEAVCSPNRRLSGPAADVLEFFYTQSAYKRIIINYVEGHEWKPWQERIIKKVVK